MTRGWGARGARVASPPAAAACVALAAAAALTVGCGAPPPRDLRGPGRVLIRMTEWQQPWFEQQLARVSQARGVELGVESYQLLPDVRPALERARAARDGTLLVKVEQRMLRPLAEAGLLRPLEDAVGTARLASELPGYLPEALAPARFGGKTWGLPRKLEVMVLVYRKAAVRRAAAGARGDRQAFRDFAAGAGLVVPEDHELEVDPGEWDMVDLFEAAHFLSRVPGAGGVGPRLAHRTADLEGTPSDFASLVYPLGFEAGAALEAMPGFPAFLRLEAAAHRGGLMPAVEDDGLTTPELFAAWRRGEVDLGFLQQVDATLLASLVEPPGSLGFAPLPRGGAWAAPGAASRVPSGGWWWCLPADGPSPKLAYDLARFLTSREVHKDECLRFGMMPVRGDVARLLEGPEAPAPLQDLLEASAASLARAAPRPALDRATPGTAWRRWKDALSQ